jgi:hypothetical protein
MNCHEQQHPFWRQGRIDFIPFLKVQPCCRLPERIRPLACASGCLADNFLPSQLEDGSTAEIHPASIVMKAVQVRLVRTAGPASLAAASNSCRGGCGKLDDDADKSKAQASVSELATHSCLLHRFQFAGIASLDIQCISHLFAHLKDLLLTLTQVH